MGILGKLNPLKSSAGPPGLELIADEGDRAVFEIADPQKALSGLSIDWNYEHEFQLKDLKGEILKEAEDKAGEKYNLREFKTWKELRSNEEIGRHLCPVRACSSQGRFLIMDQSHSSCDECGVFLINK